jgi:hypothetical protein
MPTVWSSTFRQAKRLNRNKSKKIYLGVDWVGVRCSDRSPSYETTYVQHDPTVREAYKTQLLADKALTNLDIAVSIIEIDMSCYDSQDGWIFPVQYGIEATFKPAAEAIQIF